ncbi:uncharacterized protein LOC121819183 [Ovis aries]|uniref:uncharacterized protein LOC121819183 n=1 Tax=Ovis aries TaxID=9940 RepID=UPI00295285B0|nr:uncharacterized protein LOC121819183 [Ovis aries]
MARASLLKWSLWFDRLTGAAERETGRVSVGAGLSPLPPIPQPGPVSVLRGFCLFSSRLLQRGTGFPRRVLRSGWPGDFRAVPGFSGRGAGAAVRLRRKRPGRSTERRAGPARVCRERGARGPQPPPSPHRGAGRGAGGTSRRRGGSAVETARSSRRAKRGSAARCLTGMVRVPQAPAALLPPISCCRAAWGTASPRGGRGSGCLGQDLWAPFLSRALGYVEDPGSASPGRRRREDAGSSRGAAERRGAGRGLQARRGEEQGRGVGGGGGGGTTEEHRSRFARLSVVRCLPDTMALAEVVVCAVGRVVTLPAVEITAQATALLVLVMLSAAEDNGWESPLFSGARGQPAEPRPQRPPRKPLVVWFPGGRKELRGRGRTGTFVKLGEDLNLWIRYLLLKEGMKLSN